MPEWGPRGERPAPRPSEGAVMTALTERIANVGVVEDEPQLKVPVPHCCPEEVLQYSLHPILIDCDQ